MFGTTVTSSGQLAHTRTEYVHCLACDHFARDDVHVDPEINLWAWTCPNCTTETREELR
jgi:hypothetical protein